MSGITKNGTHFWNPTNPWFPEMVCLDVPGHGYKTALNKDEAVNKLYALGFKECARELNKRI